MLESNQYPHSILTWTTSQRLMQCSIQAWPLLTSLNLLSDCSLFILGDWEGNNILDWGGVSVHHIICWGKRLFFLVSAMIFGWLVICDGYTNGRMFRDLSLDIVSTNSSVGNEFTCNAGDPGSITGLGRPAGEGIGYPFQFPCGSPGEGSACSAGDLGSIPGLERSPGEGKGYPL